LLEGLAANPEDPNLRPSARRAGPTEPRNTVTAQVTHHLAPRNRNHGRIRIHQDGHQDLCGIDGENPSSGVATELSPSRADYPDVAGREREPRAHKGPADPFREIEVMKALMALAPLVIAH
jgi:hypothetical protein